MWTKPSYVSYARAPNRERTELAHAIAKMFAETIEGDPVESGALEGFTEAVVEWAMRLPAADVVRLRTAGSEEQTAFYLKAVLGTSLQDALEESANAGLPVPPLNAELFLHLFLSAGVCDSLVGDLEERYYKLARRLGPKRADWWYRKQVFRSLWPLFKAGVRRAGSSGLVGVLSFALRLLGQGAVADELKKALGKRRRV